MSKKSFFYMLIISSFLVIFSKNWIILWCLMEINMISFTLMMSLNSKFEIPIKYLIIQLLSSSLYFISFILLKENFNNKNFLMIGMLLKMSFFPFCSWSLNMSEKMSWFNMFLLNSIQKLIPLWIMLKENFSFKSEIIMMNLFFMMLFVGNYYMSKKILMLASLVNLSWMVSLSDMMEFLMIFLFFYSITTGFLIYSLLNQNSIHMNLNFNMTEKIFIFLMISGIPPFTMFNLKWMSVEILLKFNGCILIFFLIFSSGIMIINYLKSNLNMIFLEKKNQKNFKYSIFFFFFSSLFFLNFF